MNHAIEDINNTFKQELCNKCLNWDYVVPKKDECIECMSKPYKLKLNDTCSVCLELINEDRFITECNHTFHKECLKFLNTCPLCRKTI